jgi:hypothetical protein
LADAIVAKSRLKVIFLSLSKNISITTIRKADIAKRLLIITCVLFVAILAEPEFARTSIILGESLPNKLKGTSMLN